MINIISIIFLQIFTKLDQLIMQLFNIGGLFSIPKIGSIINNFDYNFKINQKRFFSNSSYTEFYQQLQIALNQDLILENLAQV